MYQGKWCKACSREATEEGQVKRIITASLPPPNTLLPINHVNLVGEERTIKGSYIGTCVPVRDVPRYIDLFQQGKLPVDKLMSGTLRLEDINVGFDRLHAGEVVRQVITF